MPTVTFTANIGLLVPKYVLTYRECNASLLPLGTRAGGMIRKVPSTNPPQFSGTISPAAIKNVSLRVRGQPDYLERVASDSNGYFVFRGWYPEGELYEIQIDDGNGANAKIFKIPPRFPPPPITAGTICIISPSLTCLICNSSGFIIRKFLSKKTKLSSMC